MNDIKVLTYNEKELETLRWTERIYSQDRRIEYVIEKSVMLIIKTWKSETTQEIDLLNQESIRMLEEKENCKYFEILEEDTIKQKGKEK